MATLPNQNGSPDLRGPRGRRAALGGALIASTTILIAAAIGHQLGGWLLAGAALGVLIAAAVQGRPDGMSPALPATDVSPVQRGEVAEALLAAIPDPVILVDRRAIVVEMNEAAHRLLPGLKLRAPLSFALRSPDVLEGIEKVLRTGELMTVEYSERVPAERAFEVQIGPLTVDAPRTGARSGVVLFFRDLTSARHLERMRVDFIANASHELRTPLASLLGFIETLQGTARNDPKARDQFLDIMHLQARRMTRLIEDLLSLSRIEMKAHLPPEQTTDLSAVVSQIVESLRSLARERGVEIHWTAPGEPLFVRGDADELLRVAENLVENAIKYGESGGRVDVHLARLPAAESGEKAVLTVRDYGPGIAREHLPRLTERFYRADVAQSREKGGTGLGLAIVKHIVNRHRGQLTIDSEPGRGAEFRVTLLADRSGTSGQA